MQARARRREETTLNSIFLLYQFSPYIQKYYLTLGKVVALVNGSMLRKLPFRVR
jgi:hypothetical protein